jgi:hypothetical protein
VGEKVVFKNTERAAAHERASKWEVIEAIATDAAEADLAITGATTQLACSLAFERAGTEYKSATIVKLCGLAKFDHESTVRQRKEWRRYGWTVVNRVVEAGWSQEAAYELLKGKERKTQNEVISAVGYVVAGKKSRNTIHERLAEWVNHANILLTDGAELLVEVENTRAILTGSDDLAINLIRRFTERHIDAELREFFDSVGAT